MSARSIRRNHRRERLRASRSRAALAVGTAASASLLLASGADAATFTVNQTGDSGDGTCDSTCTLRDAVDDAEADVDADVIDFTGLNGPAHTIELTNGRLALSRPVSITGLGADALTIEQATPTDSDAARVFEVWRPYLYPSPAVEISGVTITGGYAGHRHGLYGYTYPSSGGGISNQGADLTLSDVTITDNSASDKGGGLYSYDGSLQVEDSTITDNTSVEDGGGVLAHGATGSASVSISGTTISDNTVTGYQVQGGGISLYGGTIEDSTITGNEVVNYSGRGGGLDLGGGASAVGTTISGNAADYGGGVYMQGDGSKLSRSTIADNDSGFRGGGVYLKSEPNAIADSTISGNEADQDGGGVFVSSGAVTARRSTIAANDAGSDGGGVFLYDSSHGDEVPLKLSSAIVADNTSYEETTADLATSDDVTISSAFSLVEGETDGIDFDSEVPATNILGVDPQLGPLADNGGPTLTQLPAPTSPAIDAGVAGGETTDQRGEDRPVDSAAPNAPLSDGSDIGAAELQDENAPGDDDVTPPETAITSGPSGSGNPASVSFAFNSPDATATFECSLDGAAFATCTSPRTLSGLADGPHVFQVRALDPAGNIDATPATRTFVVGTSGGGGGGGGPTPDTRAPETAITSVPAKVQAKGKKPATAKLEFIGIDDVTDASALTFECKLDAAGYVPCSSPSSLKVKKGTHTFSVRAKDAAGNVDASAATTTFKVKVKKAKKPKRASK